MGKLHLLCPNENTVLQKERIVGNPAKTESSMGSPQTQGKAPRCPACQQYTEKIPYLPPFFVEIKFDTAHAGDICFDGPGDILVSKRFLEAWSQAGLIGLSGFEPVTIQRARRRVRRSPKIIPEYFAVNIARSESEVDIARSGLVLMGQPDCQTCMTPRGPVIRANGIYLKESQPPAEDIFYPKVLRGRILVTQQFVDWAMAHDLLNIMVIPAEEAAFDHCFGLDFSKFLPLKK